MTNDSQASASRSATSNCSVVVWTRLLQWTMFGVVLGALPLIVRLVEGLLSADGLRLMNVLGDGELFISSAAISGGALGDLLYSSRPRDNPAIRLLIGFFTVATTLLTSLAYLVAKSGSPPDKIISGSVILFIATLISSGSCIAYSVRP